MGIEGLYRLIREHASDAITIRQLSEYRNRRFAIDATLAIYQWCSIGESRNIRNSAGKYINHIQGVFFRTLHLLESGVTPAYIFDGVPPGTKAGTIAARKAIAGRVKVPPGVYDECRRLMDLMGVYHYRAPGEAEAQAAAMVAAGLADAVATEDSDALTFGAERVIRGLELGARSRVTEINLTAVLRALKLDMTSFVDLCILMGSDHTDGTVPGIGAKRALALIQKHGTIERALAALGKPAPANFDYRAARESFLQHTTNANIPAPTWRRPTDDGLARLRTYLVDTHGLDAKKVDNGIAKLRKL